MKLDKFIEELEIRLRANMVPFIVGNQEERLIISLRKLLENFDDNKENIKVYIWSSTEGLIDYTQFLRKSGLENKYKNPIAVPLSKKLEKLSYTRTSESINTQPIRTLEQTIEWATDNCKKSILIIKDVHHLLDYNLRTQHYDKSRKLKDLIYHFRNSGSWLILLSNNHEVGEDLSNEISVIEMPLPDEEEISQLIDIAAKSFSILSDNVKIDIDFDKTKKSSKSHELKDKMIFNLRGLTETEINQVLTYTCVKNNGLTKTCLDDIQNSKKQIIEKKGYLTFVPTIGATDIGGHENLKNYIETRGFYLNEKYKNSYNLKPPKGIIVAGPPGTGKSVFAKYIAYMWKLPLVKLEISNLFNQYLGQTESRLREALSIINNIEPVIIFIDEIDKAMNNSGNNGDSNTSNRVLGTILTWMSEKESLIFIYASANNLSKLPPELKRIGRMDTIFFADTPCEDEAKDIIKIHSNLNKISLAEDDYVYLAKIAFDLELTGAEIAGGIIESNFSAIKKSIAEKKEILSNKAIIEECFKKINSYANSNKDALLENRKEALDNFQFTSEESRQKALKYFNKKI